MAASEKLISWLFANSERLNLRATKYDWPSLWNVRGLYDMQVEIEVANRKFVGRGTARGEDTAFLKASGEAIERAFCAGHYIASTGVALHTEEPSAIENVRNEIAERDAFFCHFFTNTPFTLVSSKFRTNLMREYKGIFEETTARGIWFDFFAARSSGWPVFTCVATGVLARPQFGGIIGLGSQSNEWHSIQTAFFECLRNVSALCLADGPVAPIAQSDFESILRPTPTDHQRLAMDIEYWGSVSHLFPKKEVNTDIGPARNQVFTNSWRVEPLPCPYEELRDAPVFAYRAVLDEKSGRPVCRRKERSPTTVERLSEFLGRSISQAELNSQPHFLG